MSVMMPIMFTVFSLFLPAGLALYMLTSYLIGILQQLYVNHLDQGRHRRLINFGTLKGFLNLPRCAPAGEAGLRSTRSPRPAA